MKEGVNSKDQSKSDMNIQLNQIRRKKNKIKIGRMITYIVNIISSWFIGGMTTLGMGGAYPYFNLFFFPAGPITYIVTQIFIGKGFLKHDKSKTSILLYILSLLGSLTSFIAGLYYRLTKVEVSMGTAMYGVFSSLKKKKNN